MGSHLTAKLMAACLIGSAAAPLLAAPGGALDTLPRGQYVCELPGDATGPVGRRASEREFTITNSSSYVARGLTGTYLLTGDQVTMTGGPLAGERFHRVSGGFLRLQDASGQDTTLRCILKVTNNNR